MIRTPAVAEMRRQILGLVELNRQQIRRAREAESALPSLKNALLFRETTYVPGPEPECLRSINTILADGYPIEIAELTAWRVAELHERGEPEARFEIIGVYRDGFPVMPCALLVVRADGSFENPTHPGD